MDFNQILL